MVIVSEKIISFFKPIKLLEGLINSTNFLSCLKSKYCLLFHICDTLAIWQINCFICAIFKSGKINLYVEIEDCIFSHFPVHVQV